MPTVALLPNYSLKTRVKHKLIGLLAKFLQFPMHEYCQALSHMTNYLR